MPLTQTQITALDTILENLKDPRDISDPSERDRVRQEVTNISDGKIPYPELSKQTGVDIFDFIEDGFHIDSKGDRVNRELHSG